MSAPSFPRIDLQDYASLPLSFLFGGEEIHGLPAAWNPALSSQAISDCVTEHTLTACSPEGMKVRLLCRFYHDFEAAEYTAFFTNTRDSDSPILSSVRIEMTTPGKNARLYHGNGDTCKEDGYEWWETPVTQEALTLSPCGDGTSCNGAFPYMRLLWEKGGVNAAIGWTGTWIASFRETSEGIFLSAGQKRCHMLLHPGETMRTPTLTLVSYEGNEDQGRNTWRSWYTAHILPRQQGKPLPPKCCMHLFEAGGKPEFTGATEENQLTAIDAFLENGIRPDVWWIDAGWYPCDFKWPAIGTWKANPDHFPRGLGPIGEKCQREGMELLLWFEPERAVEGSELDREHPQWMLYQWMEKDGRNSKNRAVNLGDPDCCDFIIEHVDGLIKEYGVNIYRQDFNFNIGPYWKKAEAEDRIGAVENLHIQGYYRYWDALLSRNPGLWIDSCASGGRRNDLETMRRSVPLHYTDVGYGNHPIKLKQHRQMHEWIPYFRAHNMNWCNPDGTYGTISHPTDKFSYYAAMAPALTEILRFDADEKAYALAKEMLPIWRKAAALMIGTDYYPLTECRKSSDDFYAAQFHDPKEEKGILHLLNGATAKETEFTVMLCGLSPETEYLITSAEEKAPFRRMGKDLMAGISLHLSPRSGDIWFYEKA